MNEQFNRRRFLVSVGFGAAALSAAGQGANAQSKMELKQAQMLDINPKILELKLADPRAVETLKLTSRLPKDTPITRMGLTKDAVEKLTKNARQLTKADLQALAGGKVIGRTKELTVADIASVKVAFGSGYQVRDDLAAISCCCCTPCCCAAAVDAEAA